MNKINTDFIATAAKKVRFLYFFRKLFLKFDYFHYFEQHKVIVQVILTIYPQYFPLTYQTSDSKPTLCCHCNHRRYIYNWQRSIIICFFIALINWYNYVATYIQLIYSILPIIFSNRITADFVTITTNKVSLFFVFDQNLILGLDCFYFF